MQGARIKVMVPLFSALMSFTAGIQVGRAQKHESEFHPVIPRTWDDAAMATLEVPLANPIGSPKHVPAS